MNSVVNAIKKYSSRAVLGIGVGLGLSVAGLSPALCESTRPASTVTLHYIQRPPYIARSSGGLSGLTGLPSAMAFKNANVPFELKETPFARQLLIIERNSGRDCMIGMFKKPDREQFAKFSKPVYQDKPQIILTAAPNAERFAGMNSLVDLFNARDLVLLVRYGFSYGLTLDAMINQYQPTQSVTTDENLLMLKTIKLRKDAYMFLAPEEADAAIVAAGFGESQFKRISFADMPAGEHRHLMCSKNVPDEVISKLNSAIKFKQ